MTKSSQSRSELPNFDRSFQELGLPENDRTTWLLQQQSYLRLLAKYELKCRLVAKLDPSDLIQQTLLEAWQGWDRLRATDGAQRRVWLRKILANQLAKQIRHYYGTEKRDPGRELSIEESMENSAVRLDALLIGTSETPSQAAIRDEQRQRLLKALETLPEDYRQVIILRNLQDLTHQQIAEAMNRSESAVRMLWIRALAALSKSMNEHI